LYWMLTWFIKSLSRRSPYLVTYRITVRKLKIAAEKRKETLV